MLVKEFGINTRSAFSDNARIICDYSVIFMMLLERSTQYAVECVCIYAAYHFMCGSLCLTVVCMAGRASTATSAYPTPAVYTAPVWSPGGAFVTPTGAATFAIKVNSLL